MHIVAKINQSRYLVEVSETEIAQIMGYCYPSNIPNHTREGLHVGMIIDVNKFYEALVIAREKPNALRETSKRLRSVADNLDKINLLIRHDEKGG